MGRAPCCDKANVRKGPWSPEEDSQLKQYIETYGTGGNWISLPQKAGLRRCGKSCRLRWLNYLRPNIKHGEFSAEEDRIICTLFSTIGSRWSIIAAQLPGRTDNDIKNYWNTKLKKKLMGMVSSSTTNTNIPRSMKKTQTLSPISQLNATFDQTVSNNNILNPIVTMNKHFYEPLSSSSSIPFNFCDPISGCLFTNPFGQCYETLKTNQMQMGFEFGSGFITSNNGFEEDYHQKLMNNNNNDGLGKNAMDYYYDGLKKRETEEKYCYYY